MFARLLLLLPIMLSSASGQVPTYSVAGPNDSPSIVTLRHKLDSGGAAAVKNFWDAVHKSGAPLVEAAPGAAGFSLVTFLWNGDNQTRNVVIFDGVAGFDAKDHMLHLDGSDVWYKTYRVRNDALCLQPLAERFAAIHQRCERRRRDAQAARHAESGSAESAPLSDDLRRIRVGLVVR